MPRIFAGDQINFAQHPHRSVRDVFKIADRCRDNVEAARHAPYSVTKQIKNSLRLGGRAVEIASVETGTQISHCPPELCRVDSDKVIAPNAYYAHPVVIDLSIDVSGELCARVV